MRSLDILNRCSFEEEAAMDVILLGVVILLFGLSWGMISLLERL
jgi:hypothetical protein